MSSHTECHLPDIDHQIINKINEINTSNVNNYYNDLWGRLHREAV